VIVEFDGGELAVVMPELPFTDLFAAGVEDACGGRAAIAVPFDFYAGAIGAVDV